MRSAEMESRFTLCISQFDQEVGTCTSCSNAITEHRSSSPWR